MDDEDDDDRCNAHPMPSGTFGTATLATCMLHRSSPPVMSSRGPVPSYLLLRWSAAAKNQKTTPHFEGRRSLSRRSHTGSPTPFAVGAFVLFFFVSSLMMVVVAN